MLHGQLTPVYGSPVYPHVLNPFLNWGFCLQCRSIPEPPQLPRRRHVDRLVSWLLLAQLIFEVLHFHGSIPWHHAVSPLAAVSPAGRFASSDPLPWLCVHSERLTCNIDTLTITTGVNIAQYELMYRYNTQSWTRSQTQFNAALTSSQTRL